MLEMKFAKEPFDFKLFILRFLQKIWMVPVAMIIGAVLVGGCNYLIKVVFAGPALYEVESSYYIDYYMDQETGQVYTHYNEDTWKELITSKWFVDRIWDYALAEGLEPTVYEVEKSDVPGFLSAALLTDVHIPTSYVATSTPELTAVLNKAVQKTFLDFGEEQQEILGAKVLDETPLREKDRDDRTPRACILGAVLGAFVACFGIAFRIICDESVIVPDTFSYRYGIPMLGVLNQGEEALSEEANVNLRYRFRDKKSTAVIGVKPEEVIPQVALPEGFVVISTKELSKRYEEMRRTDGVLLWVEAGRRNSKQIEHLLHELGVQDIKVTGALLYNGDSKLLKTYYMGSKKK